MFVDNDDALDDFLSKDIENITKTISRSILKAVREIIGDVVYGAPKGRIYQRLEDNGGFLGSWIMEKLSYVSEKAFGFIIQSNPDLLMVDHPYHESADGESRATIMSTSIIRGMNYDYGGSAGMSRDFWTPIIAEITEEKVESDFKKQLENAIGFSVEKSIL